MLVFKNAMMCVKNFYKVLLKAKPASKTNIWSRGDARCRTPRNTKTGAWLASCDLEA